MRANTYNIDDLRKRSIIDYLDAGENSQAFIAEYVNKLPNTDLDYDYSKLEYFFEFGITAAALPLFNLNEPIRIINSCKMQKQAMGYPTLT